MVGGVGVDNVANTKTGINTAITVTAIKVVLIILLIPPPPSLALRSFTRRRVVYFKIISYSQILIKTCADNRNPYCAEKIKRYD